MSLKETTYSLIIPVYNSAAILPTLLNEISTNFSAYNYQIIFVNDASKDNSWETLKELKANSKQKIKLISLANNAGQHAALFCGFMHANTDYIITLDDDLQHHPKEIHKLIKEAETNNADLVYGIYETKKHNPLRNAGSKLFARMVYSFASTPLHGSSFKLIKKDLAERVIKHAHFNFYLDEVLAWYSKKTAFAKVEHQKRLSGSSGYSPKTLIK
ncbi:MAG: glycosyltransferase family 2 protein, partial [Chitinophagales bacterium]|nr:glycosyltransferase family 2 protein [Chitinophagales bacterium]